MFKLTFGIRQGGVLSPYLFAAYIDDLINHVHSKQIGCMYNFLNACIVMYADDILLLARQFTHCKFWCLSVNQCLDFAINVTKSVCTRIGTRCHFSCSPILLSDGSGLQWVDNVRYFGVFVTGFTHFFMLF